MTMKYEVFRRDKRKWVEVKRPHLKPSLPYRVTNGKGETFNILLTRKEEYVR